MIKPKIFISYSWKPLENKLKVEEIAQRLSLDGIHVILDEWDLKEGQDKYHFMEQMVNDDTITKVLLFCNTEYAKKANQKSGGVGVESLIISDEIYSQVQQEKFIPIVMEYDEKGRPCLPTFAKTRIYIDFSKDERFESEYEKLVRNIYNRPSKSRPPIGLPPSYVLEEEPVFLRTAHKVKTVKDALMKNKPNTQILINDYFDTFLKALDDFYIDYDKIENHRDIDDYFFNKIDELKLLRDDFVDFLNTVIKLSVKLDMEVIHLFFEKFMNYLENYDSKKFTNVVIGDYHGDHIRFFLYEIFLYCTAIFLKEEKFEELSFLVHTPYLVNRRHQDIAPYSFTAFNSGIDVFVYRNRKLKPEKVNSVADEMKKRATNDIVPFSNIVAADTLLYYISCLSFAKGNTLGSIYSPIWFPNTSIYFSSNKLILVQKTISQRYFNRFKVILGVESKEELIQIVKEVINKGIGVIGDKWHYRFPSIDSGLNIEKIGQVI